jgi:hypothetical protein
LTPIKEFRDRNKVWYMRGPVGRNSLQVYTRLITEDVPSLKGRKITNKTGRGTGMTQLNEALVLVNKAMETTGHPFMDAYKKYNQEKKLISAQATQRVLLGDVKYGRPIMF